MSQLTKCRGKYDRRAHYLSFTMCSNPAMDHFKTLDCFLKVLLTPPKHVDYSNNQQQLNIVSILNENVNGAFELLDNSPDGHRLKELITSVKLEGSLIGDRNSSKFLETCLRSLVCVSNLLQQCEWSVQQQMTVRNVLKFVVGLGISPHLLPEVGMLRHTQTQFEVLKLLEKEEAVGNLQSHATLFVTVHTLLHCSRQSTLGSLILIHHMGDIISGLCQLSFAPEECGSEPTETLPANHEHRRRSDRCASRAALKLLMQKSYQPLVVRNLLLLKGSAQPNTKLGAKSAGAFSECPTWLSKATHRLLMERLTAKKGVESVVRGILEFNGIQQESNAVSELDRCIAVGKLLSNFLTAQETYFSTICPQILMLLDSQDELMRCQFLRIAATSIMCIATGKADLAREHLIEPMTRPLTLCPSHELSSCLVRLHKVFVLGSEPDGAFLLHLRSSFGILFRIYSFLATGVLHLKNVCQELLLAFLRNVDCALSLETLRCAVFQLEGGTVLQRWNSDCQLEFDGNGDISAVPRKAISDYEMHWLDEDAALSSSVIAILLHLKKSKIVSRFFLSLLEDLSSSVRNINHPSADSEPEVTTTEESSLLYAEQCSEKREVALRNSMLMLQILSAICQHSELQDVVVQDKSEVLQFCLLTLERWAHLCAASEMEVMKVDNDTLLLTMTILAMTIESKESGEVRGLLRSCAEALSVVSKNHTDDVIRGMADDLRVAIATHGVVSVGKSDRNTPASLGSARKPTSNGTGASVPPQSNRVTSPLAKPSVTDAISGSLSKFQLAWQDAADQEIPVKGHGLLSLRKLVESRNGDAMTNWEKVLEIFRESIRHEDSYVYLMAVLGLAALGDALPDAVLPVLIEEYTAVGDRDQSDQPVSVELRMKLGEVLVKTTGSLGEMVPKYRATLVGAFLGTSKDEDPHIRASSLSNLGEVCRHLRFSLGPYLQEIFLCLSHAAKYDHSSHVRCAAVQVITLLLRGAGVDAMKIMEDSLKDMYRLLKFVYRVDKDDTVKLHVQLALEELDKISREFIFPKQVLEKRINISTL